jgi:hypothetical protein
MNDDIIGKNKTKGGILVIEQLLLFNFFSSPLKWSGHK